jgi:hypothetical protein
MIVGLPLIGIADLALLNPAPSSGGRGMSTRWVMEP